MTTSKTPGPKPDYLVVEDHLKCQTNEGEVSLDLRIPLARLELFMEIGEQDIPESRVHRYFIDNILWPEDKSALDGMRDGAKALEIVTTFIQLLGERMGADLGESEGSTDSSEGTGEPSATTSGTTSA